MPSSEALVGDIPPVLTPGTVRGRFEKLASDLLKSSFRDSVSFIYCEVTECPPCGNLSLNLTTGVLGLFLADESIKAFTRLGVAFDTGDIPMVALRAGDTER